jgi:protein TonB
MSSPAIPLPGKFSDARFVGDLMSLFERRKVKCGDAQSFDHFTTELVSNNAFRGDLYTLCTAISHMAAEDLSGEQLLLLVARALAGPGVAKGAAVPEIPAPMRTVFLGGYEAWSKRAAAAIQEDSVWPPPRKAIPREETAPMAEDGSEAVASKSPSEGGRTIQEALEIARERSPNGLIAPRTSAPGPDIEHLTISELKKLLEEIEQRVSRMGPQLSQNFSPPANDSERRARANRGDGSVISDPLTTAEPARADALRFPRAAVLPFESAGRPVPPATPLYAEPQDELHEDPFLRRHRYLKPTERARPATVIEGTAGVTIPGAGPAPVDGSAGAATSNSPTASRVVTDGVATLPERGRAEDTGWTAALPAPAAVGTTAPVGALPAIVLPPRTEASGAGRASATAIPRDDWYPSDEENINIRIGVAGILAVAALFVIAGSLSGLFIYHSMHPKTIYDFPHLTEPAPVSMSASPHDSQVILAVPDDSAETSNPPHVPGNRGTTGGSRQPGRPTTKPSAATVWPPSNREGLRVARSEAAASATSQTLNRQTEPVHVPATTMIGYALYAPKPAYPADQAQGIGGTVELEVSISKRGNVTSAHAVSGPPQLWRAAERAVEEWRFRPYFVDGEPTEVTTTVGFFFNGE